MNRASELQLPEGMQITGPIKPGYETILTFDALALVAKLHRAFNGRRQELLKARVARQARIDAGEMPDFLPETAPSAPATGRSRRCPRRSNAATPRSPARSKPR
jgi:malate synthase